MGIPKVKQQPIIIVQGGQFGSEAKGLICDKIAHDRKIDIAVRTGTVNAGHSVYFNHRKYAFQQLPVAAFNPNVTLVLGPGAYIHPEILEREVAWVRDATGEDLWKSGRLLIDRHCGIHLQYHTNRSTESGRHHRMGATGKGSSQAVIDKVNGRGHIRPETHLFWGHRGITDNLPVEIGPSDTVAYLNKAYDLGRRILIEGTQGTLLDLHLGPYPYTTHKQTQAANWMAECGLSATLPVELHSVMRTYPIRVAGNSGPLPQELGWDQLAFDINAKLRMAGKDPMIDVPVIARWQGAVRDRIVARGIKEWSGDPATWTPDQRATHQEAASEVHAEALAAISHEDFDHLALLFETTTVTKKLRRIARWDEDDAARSVMLNRPSVVDLTFLNYVFPEAAHVTRSTFGNLPLKTRNRIYDYVGIKQDTLGVNIGYVSFGPQIENTFSLYEDEILRDAKKGGLHA